MARKRARLRRGYGEGQIREIIKDEKYEIRASGGTHSDGRRRRPSQVVYGKRTDALRALRDLQKDLDEGSYIVSDRITLGDWLCEWFAAKYGVEIGAPREELLTQSRVPGRTADSYESIIRVHILPRSISHIPLQRLRTTHLRLYFDDVGKTLSESTCHKHYIILQSALEAAVREKLIPENVARLMTGKPNGRAMREDLTSEAIIHCWTVDEVQRFLQATRGAGLQWETFFTVALDTGMRRGELCGLKWEDIDWSAGTITVRRSLTRAGRDPIFGPTKGKRLRTIPVLPDTLTLLRAHRVRQLEIRLAAGPAYHDHGLVFAKEPSPRRQDTLGCPLQANNIGQREFTQLIKAAGVKPIKFHGLRHTSATMLLSAGHPPYKVSERLGHRDVATTQEIYAHVLPQDKDELLETLSKGLGFSE
jgi:integrase